MPDIARKLAAEFFGTFTLVFAGTTAIVVDETTKGAVSHVGVSLAFGIVVTAMIYSVGDVSGCHINPAVTLGLCATNKFNRCRVLPYISVQCLGAILASILVRFLFPFSATLGSTHPIGSTSQSFIIEFMLTLILMFVVLAFASTNNNNANATTSCAGLVIGSLIALEALIGGPISGASMNPARSIAPALVSGKFDHLWLYIFAPIAGALAGVFIHKFIRGSNEIKQIAANA
jgi:MIP family channel proteins